MLYRIHGFEHPSLIPFFLASLLQPTRNTMNARPSFFRTLSDDELARLASFIASDTLLPLLASQECTFAPVIHLLISKLAFGNSIGIRFCFESSTLLIGKKSGYLSSINSMLKNCKGLRFTNVAVDFSREEYGDSLPFIGFGRLTQLFASYMDAESTSSLTICGRSISFMSFMDKNFLMSITNISIRTPPGEDIMSPIEMSLLKDIDLNLKVLEYKGIYLRYIEEIWEIVGSTLEVVHLPYVVGDDDDWIPSINQMKIHCRNLNSIQLGRLGRYGLTEEGETAYVDLICSFGPKLIQVELPAWLTEESFMKILRECVNVRIKYRTIETFKLPIVAERMETLEFAFHSCDDQVSENLGYLATAMRSCTSLTNLDVYIPHSCSSSEELMKALCTERLDSLEYLRLGFYWRICVPHSFKLISQVTSNLKKLHLSISNWVSSGRILDICRANPELSSIEIFFSRNSVPDNEWTSGDGIQHLLRGFRDCKALRTIRLFFKQECNFHKKVLNYCVPRRNTPHYIRIQYSNVEFQSHAGATKSWKMIRKSSSFSE